MKYNHNYICEPRNITIEAASDPTHSKGIKVTFFLNNKEAYVVNGTLDIHVPEEKDIEKYVSKCCDAMKATNENVIQNACEQDDIMLILYIHRHLKKVEKRSGNLIWRL